MTYVKSLKVLFAMLFVVALFVGSASFANADGEDFDYSWDTGSDGGGDVYDYSWDDGYDASGNYDYSWDTGNDGYDANEYDYSWDTGTGGYDAGSAGYDAGSAGYDAGLAGYDAGVAYDENCGCYTYSDGNIGYDSACQCYSYGSGGGYSVGGRSYQPAYSSGGYSMVRPITFSPPQYPNPKPTGGSNTNITNTNTNINTTNTNITNIDNSINDSFNNYNSNNTVVAQVQPAQPQYPVVYTQNYPVAQAPYCVIRTAQGSGSYNSGAYLAWSSANATSAYLTNVGSVPTTGTYTVYPTVTTTYTLTVYGQNQTNTCQVTVYANTTPYVSLEQIPYTGFDYGTFGNAMYFAVLASFAAGLAYLAIYYRGGAYAFAGAMLPKSKRAYAPIVAPKAPILIEKEKAAAISTIEPIVNKIRRAGTTDTMAIVQSKDGSMPKIVIERY